MRSLPSAFRIGTISTTSCFSRSFASPVARSRASIRRASFPSTSPAWMLANAITTSFLPRTASSGVATGGSAMTSSGSDRPSPLFPMSATRTLFEFFASSLQNATTSACRDVDR
jgi:hypothetical protein